jgi:hypothetical protein
VQRVEQVGTGDRLDQHHASGALEIFDAVAGEGVQHHHDRLRPAVGGGADAWLRGPVHAHVPVGQHHVVRLLAPRLWR